MTGPLDRVPLPPVAIMPVSLPVGEAQFRAKPASVGCTLDELVEFAHGRITSQRAETIRANMRAAAANLFFAEPQGRC